MNLGMPLPMAATLTMATATSVSAVSAVGGACVAKTTLACTLSDSRTCASI